MWLDSMKLRKKKKAEEEEDEVVVAAMKENDASIQAKVSAKAMDDTIVRGVIIDLTNTCVMDENSWGIQWSYSWWSWTEHFRACIQEFNNFKWGYF